MSKELIRAAGGIVHKDGNIFFTNQAMLNAYVATSAPEQSNMVGEWVSFADESPPGVAPVLMWNKTANAVHKAETYRFGNPIWENCTNCSHWLKVTPPQPAEGET